MKITIRDDQGNTRDVELPALMITPQQAVELGNALIIAATSAHGHRKENR